MESTCLSVRGNDRKKTDEGIEFKFCTKACWTKVGVKFKDEKRGRSRG